VQAFNRAAGDRFRSKARPIPWFFVSGQSIVADALAASPTDVIYELPCLTEVSSAIVYPTMCLLLRIKFKRITCRSCILAAAERWTRKIAPSNTDAHATARKYQLWSSVNRQAMAPKRASEHVIQICAHTGSVNALTRTTKYSVHKITLALVNTVALLKAHLKMDFAMLAISKFPRLANSTQTENVHSEAFAQIAHAARCLNNISDLCHRTVAKE
jgi:hypothetical protein